MKNIIALQILFFLLQSCSSTNSSSGKKLELASKNSENSIAREFEWVKNENFKPQKDIPYYFRQDFYDAEQVKDKSLFRLESLNSVSEEALEKVTGQNDPTATPVALCYKGEFSKAYAEFDKNYDQYKSNPSYWNQLGTCHFLEKKIRYAILFYHKAKKLNDRYAPALNNLGVIYAFEGKDHDALEAFTMAYNLNNFSKTPIFNILQIYLKYGLLDRFEELLPKIAREQQSEDPDVLAMLGCYYVLRKDYPRAVKNFQSLPNYYHHKVYVGLNLSYALIKIGKKDQALLVFNDLKFDKLGDFKDFYQLVKTSLSG